MRATILLIALSCVLFSKVTIDISYCYGTPNYIVIDGVVLNKFKDHAQSVNDSKLKNFNKKIKDIILNKAQEHKKINIFLDKFKYITKTDEEGYFHFEAKSKRAFFSNKTTIKVAYNEKNILKQCKPLIISKSEHIGVISDFDDTLIISDVTQKSKLINNSFFKNYKQRVLIKGMNKKIGSILNKTQGAFFVITGSPKQFNGAINNFLDFHNFPRRVLITKQTSGKNRDLLFNQFKYKVVKIKKLIKLYPQLKWIMFGDSGEKDIQVYKAIAKEYPSSVKAIYIRDVKSGKINKIKL